MLSSPAKQDIHFPAPALKAAEGTLAAKFSAAALGLAFILALATLYARAAWTATVNSDHASILLEAVDVARGNLFLHGWKLTAVSFYTTDLPFYVLGVKLCGLTPALLREVPAVIYALTVAAAVWLAGRRQTGDDRTLSRSAAFLLIGLPSLLLPEIVLVGVNHVGTTLLMILALIALDRSDTQRRRGIGLAAFGLLLTLTVFGDAMAVLLLLLPVAGLSLARIVKGSRQDRLREQWILIPTLAAFVLSRLALTLMPLLGGFVTAQPNLKFTTLDALPQNVSRTVGGLLSIYRANFFGTDASLMTLGFLGGLLGLGLVLFSLGQALRPWRCGDFGGDRINQILAASMALNLAAYLLDFDVVSFVNTVYSPPERYLVPFFIFGAILAGRLGVTRVASRRHLRAWLALPGLAYFGFFAWQLTLPAVALPAAALGNWLEARGLHDGYGNFWCASIVTAQTSGQVRIRPVTGNARGIQPLRWFSNSRWYQGTPAHFLVFDQTLCGATPFYWSDVDAAHARQSFGTPSETDRVGQYTVLIWKQDITPALADTPGASR